MVSQLFEVIFGLTVMGSVMIAIVLLLKAILWRRKGSVKKTAFVAMWILVFLRLGVPFTMDNGFFQAQINPTQIVYQAVMPEIPETRETLSGSDLTNTIDSKSSAAEGVGADAVSAAKESTNESEHFVYSAEKILCLAANVWLLITAAFLMVMLSTYGFVLHKIKGLRRVEYIKFDELKERVGVRRRVILRQGGEMGTAVYGIVCPTIVLSEKNMNSAAGIEHVLMHELVHIKRNDNLKKLSAQLLLALHWFNPLVWVARHFLENDIELACDEKVITLLGYEERKAYAQSLFLFAMKYRTYGTGSFASFGRNPVKGRVKNILVLKKKSIMRPVLAFAVILFLGMGCLTNPIAQLGGLTAYAMESQYVDFPIPDELTEGLTEGLTITDYDVADNDVYCILAPEVAEDEIPLGYRLVRYQLQTKTVDVLYDAMASGEYASGLHYADGCLYYCLNQSAKRMVKDTAIVKYNLKDGSQSEILKPYERERIASKIQISAGEVTCSDIRLNGDDQYLCWHEVYENGAGDVQDTLVIWSLKEHAVADEIACNGSQNYAGILDGYIAYQKTDRDGSVRLVRRHIETGRELSVKNILKEDPYSVYANNDYIVYKEEFKQGADIVFYDVKSEKSFHLWQALAKNVAAEKLKIYESGTWGISLMQDCLILTGASNTILQIDLKQLTVTEIYDAGNLKTGFYKTKAQQKTIGALQYYKEKNGLSYHRIFFGLLAEDESR